MKYALFLGCTIPVRGQNYELSARAVAEKLGIELVDMDGFSCCGYPVKSTSARSTLALAARNICQAQKEGVDIVTLCNACTGVLAEANHILSEDSELRAKVNEDLKDVGCEFKPGTKIKHFSRMLYEDIGLEKIKDPITRDMSDFSFSVHYGCHYLRPAEVHCFDDAEDPRTIDELIEAAGAKSVDYQDKLECCGGAILGVEEDIALQMAKKKLDHITANPVDGLITVCPFCTVMYEDNQKKIEQKYETEYGLPVLYYPQLLGLAYGMDKKQLGFRLNKVKAKDLLAKLEEGEEAA